MGKTAFRYLCALLAILFASCSKEGPLDKIEHIKMVGNDHPKQALAMLDSSSKRRDAEACMPKRNTTCSTSV